MNRFILFILVALLLSPNAQGAFIFVDSTTGAESSYTATGADAGMVTGTAGTAGNCVEWDANGDAVDAGAACGAGGGHDAVTLAGTPNYLTLSTQEITLGLIDLATDVTGTLPWSAVGSTPTTLVGYGITDAATSAQGSTADSALQPGAVDISTDTNLAVTAPVVLTGDTLSLDQHAGTDVTADLEEEAQIAATVITGNAADNGTIIGTGASAAGWVTLPSCFDESETLGWNPITGAWVCNADAGAGGGMTSWTLAGDSGGGQTISDGNTASILGDASGIDTADSATDTVTISFDPAEAEAGIEAVLDLADLQGAVTDGQVPDTITVDLATAATALAANGADCSAGSYPLGVDTSGAAASCTDATTEIDSAITTHAAVTDAHFDHADDLTELNAQISASLADGAHLAMGDVHRQAATDCTAETGGVTDEQCHEADANTLYICESGPCNGSGWVAYGGGGSWDGDIADIDLDGGTDIGADLADADLFLVDDGAGGTNRKVAASRLKKYLGERIIWRITNDVSPITASTDDRACFYLSAGFTLTGVYGSLNGAGSTSGTTTIDINEGGTSVLSTKLTVDYSESTSATAATAAVISDSALAANSQMCVEIDAVTGGADETGLVVTLEGNY